MSSARELLSRLIPPARRKLAHLQQHRRDVVWGDTQITLRVRAYPKSKEERVSLVAPQWQHVRLWSETLQKHVKLVMTDKTLRMVEDMGGLDSYLMKTPDYQLKSNPASELKWELITAIRRRHRQELAQQPGQRGLLNK